MTRFEILRSIPEEMEVNYNYDWTVWLKYQRRRYRKIKKQNNIVDLSFYNDVLYHRRFK